MLSINSRANLIESVSHTEHYLPKKKDIGPNEKKGYAKYFRITS